MCRHLLCVEKQSYQHSDGAKGYAYVLKGNICLL